MTEPEPDFVALAVEIVRADARVTVTDANIAGRLPRGWTSAVEAIRISKIGGLPTSRTVAHLLRGRLQVEAYAPTDTAANRDAAAALAALLDGTGIYGSLVVTAVEQDLGLRDLEDPVTGSPRSLFGVVLFAHAAPG